MIRRVLMACLVLGAVFGAAAALAGKPYKGNGLPKDKKVIYGLEVIAYDQCPAGTFDDTKRRQIAVQADFNNGVCSNDKTEGCDIDSDCPSQPAGGVCILEFGVCANDTGTSCRDDFECDDGNATCTDNACAGTGAYCHYDSDCLGASEFCTAGVLPKKDPDDNTLRTNQIILVDAATTDSNTFRVNDGNACDNDPAELQMPTVPSDGCVDGYCDGGADHGEACNDNSDCGPSTVFDVYLRLVGKPNSAIAVTLCGEELGVCDTNNLVCSAGLDIGQPCASDADCDNGILCSANHAIAIRGSGRGSKPQYSDVTAELLTICVDGTNCKNGNQIAIFDADFVEFFWVWNTQGRPHAQLRFVEQ